MGTGERRAAVSPGLLGTGPQHWTSSYSSRQLPPGSMLWSVGRGSPRQGDGAGRTLPPQWCRFRDGGAGMGEEGRAWVCSCPVVSGSVTWVSGGASLKYATQAEKR